ncbi:MAG TPA: molybdopterin biosynthesis protein [Clostridia bacterium]|nr:molybdopterin biosynthesis protein [Clostridia bacterium]
MRALIREAKSRSFYSDYMQCTGAELKIRNAVMAPEADKPDRGGTMEATMAYSYLENIELEEAIKTYTAAIKSEGYSLKPEEISVGKSLGRMTSEAVFAKISSPHYNACAMDGIALFAKSTFGATETTPVILKEGEDYERVDTGDPLPERFDSVVMIEDVIENGAGTVKLIDAASPWQNIRQIGEDICASEMIVPSNTVIGPAMIGAMLAGGVLTVMVWKKPVVGLIPTGDEIVSPTDNPGKGEIIEFNSSIFSAMLENWGAEVKVYGIVPDRFPLIKEAVQKAAAECDMVVLNAGSSAGREDFSSRAVTESGRLITHGIAIRPGKPAILGIVNGRPIVGVPGYPVSGIIVMDRLFKRVLESLMHVEHHEGVMANAVLSRKIVSSLKYKEFVRMKLGAVDGKLIATPLNRGAGVVTSFVKADGLMEIPINSEGYEAGREVDVELLRDRGEIENTLVVTGSHDPLIDLVSDLLRRKHTGEYIASSHVGSMGGITAVRRGEAHLAGIHLLDEETGGYNESYINKYLSTEKIFLIRCVKRIQGLMIAKGNPKNIKDFEDIAREGISYVNRQKGSGTRVLLNYLLKKKGMASGSIYGYDREEFTHMSVAALVASGSADAGMGIYSAAHAYDLDFIPVCEEQYDFIMPVRFTELEIVKHFISILESSEFKAELDRMGGYRLDKPGEMRIFG